MIVTAIRLGPSALREIAVRLASTSSRRHDDILQQRSKDRNWQNKQWATSFPDVLRPLGNKFNIMQLKGLIPEGILRTVKAEYWVRKTSLRAALRLGPATPVTSSAAHLHYPAPVGTAYLAHMCIQLSCLIRHLTRRGNLSAHGQAGTGLNSLRLTIL